uniref:Uncharacterized protein n=1 Tax=Lepeophtheirus salmonis TaxID=72036 RepID=A0A0K2UQG4_LEPSM
MGLFHACVKSCLSILTRLFQSPFLLGLWIVWSENQ